MGKYTRDPNEGRSECLQAEANWGTKKVLLQNENPLSFCGDIDKTRFLQRVK